MSDIRTRTADPPEVTEEVPLKTALAEIADSLGEVYKHVALINRRLAHIERAAGLADGGVEPTTKVTLVRVEETR